MYIAIATQVIVHVNDIASGVYSLLATTKETVSYDGYLKVNSDELPAFVKFMEDKYFNDGFIHPEIEKLFTFLGPFEDEHVEVYIHEPV